MIVKVNMIFFTICFALLCCCIETFVLFPASSNIHQNRPQENRTVFNIEKTENTNGTRILPRLHIPFDFKTYRSSWKFIDKHTIRIRFHLNQVFLHRVVSSRFYIRHIQSGQIRTYHEPHETINSTVTLYAEHLKHGRHMVCLLVYTSKYTVNPRHIFCQDIVNNFHKYGNTDMDADDERNTFVFLLTQYAIVCGILCILQIVHTVRKQRLIRTFYDKATALRQTMLDYHHQHRSIDSNNKSSPDLTKRSHAIEYLIYNLDRRVLNNFDQIYTKTTDVNNVDPIDFPPRNDHEGSIRRRYKKTSQSSTENATPLLRSQRSISKQYTIESEDEEDDGTNIVLFTTGDEALIESHEDQSTSFKSMSHILDNSKPWIAKLNDDGTVKNILINEEPLTSSCRV